jgi:hypothetical protein
MGKQTSSQKATDPGKLEEPAAASSETVGAVDQTDAEIAGTATDEDELEAAPAESKPSKKIKAGDVVDVRVLINGGRFQNCSAVVVEPPNKAGELLAEFELVAGKKARHIFQEAGTQGASYVWSRGGAVKSAK